jgi:hypothetical protein
MVTDVDRSDRTADQILTDVLTPQGRSRMDALYAQLTRTAGDPATLPDRLTKQALDWRDCYEGDSFEESPVVGRMPRS